MQQAMYDEAAARDRAPRALYRAFRAKATKARQAQSRLKALDRMERISAAHVDAPFDFHFAEPYARPIRCWCSTA